MYAGDKNFSVASTTAMTIVGGLISIGLAHLNSDLSHNFIRVIFEYTHKVVVLNL